VAEARAVTAVRAAFNIKNTADFSPNFSSTFPPSSGGLKRKQADRGPTVAAVRPISALQVAPRQRVCRGDKSDQKCAFEGQPRFVL
jgi:hypothetical protein